MIMFENLYHNHKYFYKYVTFDTACKILTNLEGKWSSPLLFNDPFDIQNDLAFGFKMEKFLQKIENEIKRMFFDSNEPVGDESSFFLNSIKLLRQNPQSFPKEQVKAILNLQIREIKKLCKKYFMEKLKENNEWWHSYIKDLRVFCLAEEHDNLLMWSHYADSHKGAVIKFKCLPEFNTAFCAAKKVVYQKKVPVLEKNLDNFIKYVTAQKKIAYNNLFERFAFTKSIHWIYEKEWRAIHPKSEGNKELCEFFSFLPEEIFAVYLGCKMEKEDENKIISIINDKLEHVEIYKATKDKKNYKLNFERIK